MHVTATDGALFGGDQAHMLELPVKEIGDGSPNITKHRPDFGDLILHDHPRILGFGIGRIKRPPARLNSALLFIISLAKFQAKITPKSAF